MTNVDVSELTRIFFEVVLFAIFLMYLIFAFINMRQIRLMNKSFTTPLSPVFDFVALINLGAAVFFVFIGFTTLFS